jgi:hypothetical protein
MDLVKSVIGLIMFLVGIAIIISPELSTIIGAVLLLLGAVAVYEAIQGIKN